MKILVTGANGQVGSELQFLTKQYADFDFLFTDLAELDITNEKAVSQLFVDFQPTYCINCAAYTAVDKAETDSTTATLINETAVKYLAKACSQYNSTFLHISSDYVYHNQVNRPLKETDKLAPKSVYASTKLAGDIIALMENSNTIILRTSWIYSSFGHNFVKTMLRLGKERAELKVVYDQIGVPTYARDLAKAMLDIIFKIEAGKKGFRGVYNFAPTGVTSWYDFAKAIFEIENINCKVEAIPSSGYPVPAKRPFYSVLNCEKIRRTFGLAIPYWKDSLKDCLGILAK